MPKHGLTFMLSIMIATFFALGIASRWQTIAALLRGRLTLLLKAEIAATKQAYLVGISIVPLFRAFQLRQQASQAANPVDEFFRWGFS
jgi:hypothetical protein